MLEFNKEPFSYLPFHDNNLFDLGCEYCIIQIEQIQQDYIQIKDLATSICGSIANNESYVYFKRPLFSATISYIESYSKLVKMVKNLKSGIVQSTSGEMPLLNVANHNPNTALQELVSNHIRNTLQHFEDRISRYEKEVDPFFEIYYNGNCVNWGVKLGQGQLMLSGSVRESCEEVFDIQKLLFSSYTLQKGRPLKKENVAIEEIWNDVIEFYNLLESNVELIRREKCLTCQPVRSIDTIVRH